MGNSPSKDVAKDLLLAIQRDDLPTVTKLLKGLPNEKLNDVDQEGGTIVHCAAGAGSLKVLNLLVETLGIGIDQQDIKSRTALHRACDMGHVSIVQELLKRGSRVNVQDEKCRTPLHLASFKGHLEVVKLLLKVPDIALNMQLKNGQTALQLAVGKNYAEVVKALLDAKADVNLQTKEGLTALHSACDDGYRVIVSELVDAKADVNIQDKKGYAPLHLVAQKGHKDLVQDLLREGLRVNIRNNDGWTALHIAARDGHKGVVESLLQAGADVNSELEGRWTALHIASQNGNKDIVQALVIKGAQVDLQSSLPELDGWSALHVASVKGHKDVVEVLITAQANVVLKTKNGDTALSLAVAKLEEDPKNLNHGIIADILDSASAMKKFKAEDPASLNRPTWVVDRNEIVLTEKELGRGGWGIVKVAEFRGLIVAAKCFYNTLISEYNIGLFKREINLAAIARHPNLLQFIGATMEGQLIILTERMPTSLRAELEKLKGALLSRPQILSISRDVALGLNYLHSMKPDPVIHRDVSSANVLLERSGSDTWKAKVSDYGTAMFQEFMHTPCPGNATYASPESSSRLQQSVKMDTYSYGVLLLEMCTGKFPNPTTLFNAELPQLDASWDKMAEVVRICLKVDPNQRPYMDQLLEKLEKISKA